MNRISPEQETVIDRMMFLGYPIRVIAEIAQVSRQTVQVRREPMVYGRGFWFVICACGKPVIDPDTDHFHDQEPCKRRARRNRLLLRIVRKGRSLAGSRPGNKLSGTPDPAKEMDTLSGPQVKTSYHEQQNRSTDTGSVT